ncbi:ABC transporter permease [Idiomarina xiamenensis]|uniref:ABC transporter permease n=1 Tax=Idiomarina xiamenensis 10-D-4 TaxID=740709 RepID=K2KPL2_9GAMM|nr:ABC transporter permease [Idiomarina xiamenensis]EKE84384.1 ABC transporter permease [Idiomarina xiamenensis 10-D-4]
MKHILWRRAWQALLMAWSVATLTFILLRSLPGNDMAYRIAAGRYGDDAVSAAAAQAVSQELQLQQSAWLQYGHWLADLLTLNLGNSLVTGAPVVDELSHQLGYTLVLAAAAILVAVLLAIPLGLWSGFKAGGTVDNGILVGSVLVRAQPVFTLGLLLIFMFALGLGWLPVAGFREPQYVVLPALTLGLSLAAIANRVVRNSTVQVLNSAYYEFAQLKGLSPTRAFWRHGLRNVLVPTLAFMGIQLIGLVEGVIMIESLFAWPGIGHGLSHAVFARDIPMLQGTALVMGLLFVLVNTLVDISCYWLDPRSREP